MRRTYSYSKRDSLESCARRYFYDYYAGAKSVPFDVERKATLRAMKELKNRHLWAGEILHSLIQLRLARGQTWSPTWFLQQAVQRFDRAVVFSRNPTQSHTEKYPPPMLSEFAYREPDAEESVQASREKLTTALNHFLVHPDVTAAYRKLLTADHLVEQKVGGLKLAGFSLDGKIDLVAHDASGVAVLDWKIGEDDDSSEDSLQLLIYSWWAGNKFGEAPERIRSRKIFLSAPELGREVQVNQAVIRRGRARVVQDIQMIEELDDFGRRGIEEAFTPCEKPNVCRQCKYRGICSAGSSVMMLRPTSMSLPVLQAVG